MTSLKQFLLAKRSWHDRPVSPKSFNVILNIFEITRRICQQLTFAAFRRIRTGYVTMELPDGQIRRFGDPTHETAARIKIHDTRFFTRMVLDGEIGFGESYVQGEWSTPDISRLLRVLILNRNQLSDGNWVTAFLTQIKERISHSRLRNTIQNSRDNIATHYDLGNDFFSLFLDEHMIYSCAMFLQEEDTLETAQVRKMQTILDKADIQATDHILEIGCGWGGFALYAARKTGCRVTGITVSPAQYELALKRVEKEGLSDKIDIQMRDYRQVEGQFDKIISIEMIEAVGEAFFEEFFECCDRYLKPKGRVVLQAITTQDDLYEASCRTPDWIKKHIFPGGQLPSVLRLRQAIDRVTEFSIKNIDRMGPHYVKTLQHWRQRFQQNRRLLEYMGFDDHFQRKWKYYFSICEAGFENKAIDLIQMVLARPDTSDNCV
jgi:cyclopropane-fatty-acyl-phospholipid synthase